MCVYDLTDEQSLQASLSAEPRAPGNDLSAPAPPPSGTSSYADHPHSYANPTPLQQRLTIHQHPCGGPTPGPALFSSASRPVLLPIGPSRQRRRGPAGLSSSHPATTEGSGPAPDPSLSRETLQEPSPLQPSLPWTRRHRGAPSLPQHPSSKERILPHLPGPTPFGLPHPVPVPLLLSVSVLLPLPLSLPGSPPLSSDLPIQ